MSGPVDAAYSRLSLLVDPGAVHRAMDEYDALGQDAFLAKYGFGRSREYVLVREGRDYDSKAVAGAALAFQDGVEEPLPRDAFSGGLAGAVRHLRRLGFTVERRRVTQPVDLLDEAFIRQAIDEFHRLGREAFLARFDAHPAEKYVIVDQGVAVDAKAVVHAAWRLQHPAEPPLEASEVRGDRRTIAEPLRRLGFWVDDLSVEPVSEPPLGRDPQTYIDAAQRIDGPLDRRATATSRAEQQLLRGALGLFRDESAPCDLCGLTLPSGLLVAAHIKPRAKCDESERRDLPHVAMRACLLGCDALFERRLLFVTASGTLATRMTTAPSDLAAHLSSLSGRPVISFTPDREAYFAWHRETALLPDTAGKG